MEVQVLSRAHFISFFLSQLVQTAQKSVRLIPALQSVRQMGVQKSHLLLMVLHTYFLYRLHSKQLFVYLVKFVMLPNQSRQRHLPGRDFD